MLSRKGLTASICGHIRKKALLACGRMATRAPELADMFKELAASAMQDTNHAVIMAGTLLLAGDSLFVFELQLFRYLPLFWCSTLPCWGRASVATLEGRVANMEPDGYKGTRARGLVQGAACVCHERPHACSHQACIDYHNLGACTLSCGDLPSWCSSPR